MISVFDLVLLKLFVLGPVFFWRNQEYWSSKVDYINKKQIMNIFFQDLLSFCVIRKNGWRYYDKFFML